MDVHQSVDQSMSTIKTTIHKFEQAQKYMDRTDCKNWAQDIINELNVANDQLISVRQLGHMAVSLAANLK